MNFPRIQALQGDPVSILSFDEAEIRRLVDRCGSPCAAAHLAWWTEDMTICTRQKVKLDRPRGVPVLLVDQEQRGRLGWLQLQPTHVGSGARRNFIESVCIDVHRHLTSTFGDPHSTLWPKLDLPELDGSAHETVGNSAALALFLEWVFSGLGLTPRNDIRCPLGRWVATGGWNPETGELETVASETIAAKTDAAGKWGYDTLVVVEGQEGESSLDRKIELPRDPALALARLLEEEDLRSALQRNRAAAISLLRAIGRTWLEPHSRRTEPLPQIVASLESGLGQQYAEIRAIAADLLCRSELHRGGKAAIEHLETVRNVLPACRFHDLVTIDYFRGEWSAVVAEGLIDAGVWDSTATEWETLQPQDSDSPPWDLSVRFASFLFDNTRSFRDLFQARVSDSREEQVVALHQALDGRLKHQDHWPDLWRMTSPRQDTYPRRQSNLLIEVLWTAHLIDEDLDPLLKRIQPAMDSLESAQKCHTKDSPAFDRLGRWTWAHLTGDAATRLLIEDQALTQLATAAPEPYEASRWLLERIAFERTEGSLRALEILARCVDRELQRPPAPTILAVLSARTAMLVLDGATARKEAANILTSSLDGTLRELRELVWNPDPNAFYRRAPY